MEKRAGIKFWCYKVVVGSARKNFYHTDHTLTDLQLASADHVLSYPQIASLSVSHHLYSGTVRRRLAHTPTWCCSEKGTLGFTTFNQNALNP